MENPNDWTNLPLVLGHGFVALALLTKILSQVFCHGSYPEHCTMLGKIPGLWKKPVMLFLVGIARNISRGFSNISWWEWIFSSLRILITALEEKWFLALPWFLIQSSSAGLVSFSFVPKLVVTTAEVCNKMLKIILSEKGSILR